MEEDIVIVGRVTGVYGIKGWVKIHSYTDPVDNLLNYEECFLREARGWQVLPLDQGKCHGKGLVAHIKGCDDRELARLYAQKDIGVRAGTMPALESGDYYWHQLLGLEVWSRLGAESADCLLGKVEQMIETGANDVIVVAACEGSIDQQERLIPYRPDEVVIAVELDQGRIIVDWDPSY